MFRSGRTECLHWKRSEEEGPTGGATGVPPRPEGFSSRPSMISSTVLVYGGSRCPSCVTAPHRTNQPNTQMTDLVARPVKSSNQRFVLTTYSRTVLWQSTVR